MAAAPRTASEAAQVPRAIAPLSSQSPESSEPKKSSESLEQFPERAGGGFQQASSHPTGFCEGPAGTQGVGTGTTGQGLAQTYFPLMKTWVRVLVVGVASGLLPVPGVQLPSGNHLDQPTTFKAVPASEYSNCASYVGALVTKFRLKPTVTSVQLTKALAPCSNSVLQFLIPQPAIIFQFLFSSDFIVQSVSRAVSKLFASHFNQRSVRSNYQTQVAGSLLFPLRSLRTAKQSHFALAGSYSMQKPYSTQLP